MDLKIAIAHGGEVIRIRILIIIFGLIHIYQNSPIKFLQKILMIY
jgi:hypothetical protein